ncbi:hypothetical protein [Sinorhizobium fredii]|uniref:hypothetical protein n=1 Tax=Rhizobium fredii TaxID=380 RepID=UPI003517DC8A
MRRRLSLFSNFLLIAFTFVGEADADSYWIENGGTNTATCSGATGGTMLKLANTGDRPVLITGLLNCLDKGTSYELRFEFLSIRINPSFSSAIQRETLEFDWLGLAIYRPKTGDSEKIDWQYDDAKMIHGSLKRDSNDVIYFGNLSFDVPKQQIEGATRFTFYLTWKGQLETFVAL